MRNTLEAVKRVLSRKAYIFLALIIAIAFYLLNVIIASFSSLKSFFLSFSFLQAIKLTSSIIIGFKSSILLSSFISFLLTIFFVLPGKSPTARVVDNPGDDLPGEGARVETLDIGDDPILGDENAPITIFEFSDYQCPFCRKFWQDSYPQIKENYIDTGKVKLVLKDFPLSFHPLAVPAATAANCVQEMGGDEAYFKMHDKLFEEQNILDGGSVKSTVQFTEADIKNWAKEIGYNIDSCLASAKFDSEIQEDFDYGASNSIQGTPGFLIGSEDNGYVVVSGAQPYSAFKQVIDAELA